MNLPEERLRLGKVSPFGSPPQPVGTRDTETTRLDQCARDVAGTRAKFEFDDLQQIVARLWLDA